MRLVDLEADDPRWEAAFPVLQELRGHLTRELLRSVLSEGAAQGLRFTGVFDGDRCLAVAGWRVVVNTSALRKLYVDDLSTTAGARSTGVGALLLAELRERGQAAGCVQLELDSGVTRHAAHRFYLRERMRISAYHFIEELA